MGKNRYAIWVQTSKQWSTKMGKLHEISLICMTFLQFPFLFKMVWHFCYSLEITIQWTYWKFHKFSFHHLDFFCKTLVGLFSLHLLQFFVQISFIHEMFLDQINFNSTPHTPSLLLHCFVCNNHHQLRHHIFYLVILLIVWHSFLNISYVKVCIFSVFFLLLTSNSHSLAFSLVPRIVSGIL